MSEQPVADPTAPAAPPPSPQGAVPTLFEWMGGQPALDRLTARFYARVPDDALLGSVFAGMAPAHAQHVAWFLAEVLGGPAAYDERLGGERGGHARMVTHHLGRGLTEAQRARWVALLLDTADEV
ncbi:MAG TPA: hypothetical protein VEA99_01295, partial [Gemmatimonadaceae bacterium]|nr:hypothetical protein [Gemmatimonadaceae bacterium]